MAASTAVVSSALAAAAGAGLASSRSSVHGAALSVAPAKAPVLRQAALVSCRATADKDASEGEQHLSRRLALALVAGAAVATGKVSTADAAYGEAANVFGSPKQQTGFTTFAGDGFKLDIPSKWNPSKETEFPGTVLRYEDNFDQKSNLSVMITPTDKSSVTDYGSPEAFLDAFNFLLGKQSYAGKTYSEGGFDPNAVATASLLNSKSREINGKTYYDLDILTRTADGDEGGTHQLIVATIKDGKLYTLKAQAGDKRWFKGAQKFVKGAAESFSVA